MKCQYRNQGGFTLIEVVAVMILTSLAAVFAAMLLVTSTEIFVSNREAAEDSQKIQAAMNRLVKELTYAGAGTLVVSDGTVQWTSRHPERAGEAMTATWNGTSGTDLTLQGVALMDNVSAFTASATTDSITLTLQTTRSNTHSTTVHPRYDL